MLLSGLGQLLAPSDRISDLLSFGLEVLDGLFDGFRPLIRPEVPFPLAFQDITIELLKHFLEMRDK
jgi:hypothetical protein